ncbi:MAG: PhoH family protein, partial [cyanobacterium endosymbiont of Rhopalodia inflata]
KMVLTRLGLGSKMVVTGDITQTDLPRHQDSGLVIAKKILTSVKDIAFCQFFQGDVVRHPLVQKIVEAYERFDT